MSKNMPEYLEDNILSAMQDIESGFAQRRTTYWWGIPQATINARLNSCVNRLEVNEHNQHFSKEK
ncbi:hypothetical protein V8C42DRAFT_327484 [Trichoderma barbatum]